jgi:hypothetical protein
VNQQQAGSLAAADWLQAAAEARSGESGGSRHSIFSDQATAHASRGVAAVQRGLHLAVALVVDTGRRPAPAGAAGQWLARKAPELVTTDGLRPRVVPQSFSVPPACGGLRCFRRDVDETGCQQAACRQRRPMPTQPASRINEVLPHRWKLLPCAGYSQG